MVMILSAAGASAQSFTVDGFEGPTLFTFETPPGQWSAQVGVRAGNTLALSSMAAHRGASGLRFVDVNAGLDAGVEGELRKALSPALNGDVFFRVWVRVSGASATGEAALGGIWSSASPSLEVRATVSQPGGVIELWSRARSDGALVKTTTSASLPPGTWHLLEGGALGVGTANGEARLWLDGQSIANRTGLDWSGLTVDHLSLAEYASNDLRFTGTVDFDDHRSGRSALGSMVKVIADVSSLGIGDCKWVTVSLIDSLRNTAATVPYPLTIDLSSDGAGDGFYTNSSCTSAVTSVSISEGRNSADVYVRFNSTGPRTLTASHLDFVPVPISLTAVNNVQRLQWNAPYQYFITNQCTGDAGRIAVQLNDFAFALTSAGPGGQPFSLRSTYPQDTRWFTDPQCLNEALDGAFTMPPGSNSIDVYLIGSQPGQQHYFMSTTGNVMPSSPLGSEVMTPRFEDTFETGTTLRSDLPEGRWSAMTLESPQSSLQASPLAAHRGQFGLRLIDGAAVSGMGLTTFVEQRVVATRDNFTRVWMRMVSHNGQGVFIALYLGSRTSSPLALYVHANDNQFVLAGFEGGVFQSSVGGALPDAGEWHLYETAITGLGTTAAHRRFYLDGRLIIENAGVNGLGQEVHFLGLGQYWSDDRNIAGVFDFDDLRSATTPHASHFGLMVPAGGHAEECLPVEISLLDSISGALAAAPYDLTAELSVSQLPASFFSSADCAVAVQSVVFSAGQSMAVTYVRARNAGTAQLRVSHVDLLSAETSVAFLSALAPDAGIDAGTTEDAGTSEGVDGGSSPKRNIQPYQVRCGCSTTWAASSFVVISAAASTLLKRRGRKRAAHR